MSMSRREWAASWAAAALLPKAQNQETYAVIGAGVFGAWTAYHLVSAGHKVILLDQYGPASSRASSGGESRIISCSYGPDEVYTRMAKRSLALWSRFFAETGRNLLHRIGVLWMAKPNLAYVEQSRETLRKFGIPFRDLSPADLQKQYPQIHTAAGTIAILTSSGESIPAGGFVFACGPWLGKVFPHILGNRIFPTRQEVFFFGIPSGDRRFSLSQIPVWIDFSDERGMYGFPDLETRGFKVAFDKHGPLVDPDTLNRFVMPEKVAAARAYVNERFPALGNSPIVDSRVCQYENTANGDFIIDRHPDFENVWIAGGGSGHGFKHGPAVGEYTAARVTGARNPPVEPRFS